MTSARTQHGPPPTQWTEERQEPKTLKDLYTTGTHMAEVSPDFQGGIDYGKWRMLKITEQCSELSQAFLSQFMNGVPDGMKGVR